MEMSHRSKAYETIIKEAEADLRELMNIPDNYKVLFLQGLLICLLCPLAGDNIVCHLIFHEVHGNHGKLLACPALQRGNL